MTDLRLVYGGLTLSVSVDQLLADNCDRHYTSWYQKDASSELSALCDRYGSDKGALADQGHPYPWPPHTYADFYEARFAHCRPHITRVFECGLGTNNPNLASTMGAKGRPGASLRVWRDYFPNAMIYGADIDRDILFQEERIATFFVDQTSPDSIRELWRGIEVEGFDLMIDDGLHTFEAGVCLFEHGFAQLKPAGLYVIEDVLPASMPRFQNYFKTKPHRVEFVTLHRPNLPLHDNALIVIRR